MSKAYIGGQAVIEGVMMRSPKSFVVAVRRPDGSIAVREQAWVTLFSGLPFLRWPILRGGLVLLESMHNGYSALKFSSEHGVPDEEENGEEEAAPAKPAAQTPSWVFTLMTLVVVALVMATPHMVTALIGHFVGPALDSRTVLFQFVEVVIRALLIVGYIFAISRTKDAARLFQYHGAEHKAIWTYESGQPLTVEYARKFTTLHPRCGTSFLAIVLGMSLLVHLATIPFIPQMHPNGIINNLLLVLIKLPLLIPIGGLAYELQKLSARDNCPAIIKWLTRPGIWLQNVTTKEPTPEQLEIALIALERALAREEGRSRAPDGVAFYPNFAGALAA